MSEVNEVGRVLDAIKRLSPEHRQRAESVAVVVEQALASAQTTIAALEKRIAELEAFVKCPIGLDEASDICSAGTCHICLSKLRQTFDAERQRRESAEAAIQAIAQSDAEPQDVRQKFLGAMERRRFAYEGGRYLLTQSQAFDAFVEVLSAFPALAQFDAKPQDVRAKIIQIMRDKIDYTVDASEGYPEGDNIEDVADMIIAALRSRAVDRSEK